MLYTMSNSRENTLDIMYMAVAYHKKTRFPFTVSEFHDRIVDVYGDNKYSERTVRRVLDALVEKNMFRKKNEYYMPSFTFEQLHTDKDGKFDVF